MAGPGSPDSTELSVVREMPTRRAISTVPRPLRLAQAREPIAELKQQLAFEDVDGVGRVHLSGIIAIERNYVQLDGHSV
jgi:hypothetical protein